MSKRPETRQTLAEILASCSETLDANKISKATVYLDSTDVEDDTPLHVMLWRDDIHAAKSLIEAGADLNAVGDMSETRRHLATRRGQLGIIALLLDKGADPDMKSEFDQTPRSLPADMDREIRQVCSNR